MNLKIKDNLALKAKLSRLIKVNSYESITKDEVKNWDGYLGLRREAEKGDPILLWYQIEPRKLLYP